ncbi:MAG: hypothetical protein ACJ74Q_15500 [Pyrinomonadaceae bacterium]
MTTEGNKRAKGKRPGIQKARFESIARAINAVRPEAAAMVVGEDRRDLAISVHVGGDTSARFKGFAGTWRASVVRLVGDTPVDTGSKLIAASALAYTEKDPDKVAAALLAAVDRSRGEILDYSLMLDVAELVNELRPGSEAAVEADSPGAVYVDVRLDERHRVHFGHDLTWGGSLMRVVREGETEDADHVFTTDIPHTEIDPGRIAKAIVEAIESYAPQN